MPDPWTLLAYDTDARTYADEWHDQPPPTDLHAVVREFFAPGPTADIGCGSGRDTAWLSANGYPATGYDASTGLLDEARRRYPALQFLDAVLPELDEVEPASFANVLCETVIMHLPPADVAPSVRRMLDLLRPGGTLYLSWRVTPGADRRDENGRLYAAFDASVVLDELAGAQILHDEETVSASSVKIIHRLIARV
ncbi:MAG: Methyltransferase type 11 [Pseudonocardiales bacterium]|nr:Methyltransferase type 11 [Pseudonocardiales bacterium]